ncbi:MAG: macrolide family glycosyltransferase [Ruminiclostridium sp.]
MSRVLFVNGNAHGHINPTLALVRELVNRGEEVTYFSTEAFRKKLEAMGANFQAYGEKLDNFLKSFTPSSNHPFYTLLEIMLKMDEQTIPLVIETIKGTSFDYIIHDSMFGGGKVLANMLGIPAVCSCTSFAMAKLPLPPHMLEPGFHPQLDMLFKEMFRLSSAWKIDPLKMMDIFFKKENLNIVYTSKLFQPDSESFDESFKFVGPSIDERHEDVAFELEGLEGHKVVYISMGTINNNCRDFYKKCIKAFGNTELKVVMAIGHKVDIASIGAIPDNFIVRNYVHQLEVLKKTDTFISHGGLNSVSEALYYGIPVVTIPQANDQPMVAKQLVALGAGIGLKLEEVTPEVLKEAALSLLSENTYKAAARRIGESFREAGGYKTAVDDIFEYKMA